MKGRDSMRNCIWLIRKSMKVCPQRLPAMLLVALLDGVNAVNIILFYKYAVQALYQKDVLKQMAIVVLIYLAIHCIHSVVNNYLTQVKYPIWNETIKQSLSKEIYQKYQSLSADTVQEPKFFDSYKKALDESENGSRVKHHSGSAWKFIFCIWNHCGYRINELDFSAACHHSSLHICTGKFEDRENEISVQHVLCEAKPYGRVHHKIILSTRIS